MSDRELLELAAKAAGLPWYQWVIEGDDSWNPLTDDGDALRLAVHLGLLGGHEFEHYRAREVMNGNGIETATRRAIVRAAAEIGRNVP